MKVKFQCDTMDKAGALHNALLDYVSVPEGMEVNAHITFGGGGNDPGWGVTIEERPKLYTATKKKAPQSEASSRAD